MRETTIWFPTADAGEAVFGSTATKGGGGATRALLAATQEDLPLHVFTGEPRDRLGGAGIRTPRAGGGSGGPEGAFAQEIVEHETGGVLMPEGELSEELGPEKAFGPEPEADESGEDFTDDQSEPDLD